MEGSIVKVLQKWNGKRIEIDPWVHEFRIWLTQQEINLTRDKRQKATLQKSEFKYSTNNRGQTKNITKIVWIEKLLQIPIEDYRKDCLWRIIGPYLLNVRNLSELKASKVMEEWLAKCDKKRKLDFEPRTKIYSIIKGNKGFKPISFAKLKEENKDLYFLLESKNVIQKKV